MTHHYGLRRWSVVFTSGLVIALAGAGLVACGYNGSAQSSSPSTQPQSQVTSPPTRVIPASTHTTQPLVQSQLQKCGFVHGYGALEVVPKDLGGEQAESCFWQAFQHCRPATLVFTTSVSAKVPITLMHTFMIHNEHSNCLISDAQQFGVASNRPPLATIFTCTGLIRHPRALDILSCGQEGTVVVLGA